MATKDYFININDAIRAIMDKPDMTDDEKMSIILRLKSVQPASVVPAEPGKWKETKTGFICTRCKKKAHGTSKGALLSKFCPECGAPMTGP